MTRRTKKQKKKTKKNCHYRMKFRNKSLRSGGTTLKPFPLTEGQIRGVEERTGKSFSLKPSRTYNEIPLSNDELYLWNDNATGYMWNKQYIKYSYIIQEIVNSHVNCFPETLPLTQDINVFFNTLRNNTNTKLYYYIGEDGFYRGHFTVMYNGTLSELDKYNDPIPRTGVPSITALVPETQMHLIFNVCVSENHRGQKICNKMLKKLFDLNPNVPFALNVLVNNVPAQKCYEKLGFMYLKQNDTYIYMVGNYNPTFSKLVYYGHGEMGEVAPKPVPVPSEHVPFKSINYYVEPYTALIALNTTNRILDICQDQIKVKEHSHIAISNMRLTSNIGGPPIIDEKSHFGIYLCSDIGIVKLYGYDDLLKGILLSELMNHFLNDFKFYGTTSGEFFSKIDLYVFACRSCPTMICPSKNAKYFDGRFGEQFPLSPTVFDITVGGGRNKTKSTRARSTVRAKASATAALAPAAPPVNILQNFEEVNYHEMVQVLMDNKTCPTECPNETSA